MKRFIDSQGSEIDLNILYQDNMSTIKLAENVNIVQEKGQHTLI